MQRRSSSTNLGNGSSPAYGYATRTLVRGAPETRAVGPLGLWWRLTAPGEAAPYASFAERERVRRGRLASTTLHQRHGNRAQCSSCEHPVTAVFAFSGTAYAYSWEGPVWPNQPSSGCCLILHPTEHATASYDITGWSNGAAAWNGDHNANYGLDFSGTMPQISVNDVFCASFSPRSANCNPTVGSSEDGWTNYNYGCNIFGQNCTFTNADAWLNEAFTGTPQYTPAVIQSVAAHELGHVAGLGHANGCVVMNKFTFGAGSRWEGCGVNTPQTDDDNGINAHY